jgi:type IV secretory pathway TrbL component
MCGLEEIDVDDSVGAAYWMKLAPNVDVSVGPVSKISARSFSLAVSVVILVFVLLLQEIVLLCVSYRLCRYICYVLVLFFCVVGWLVVCLFID